MARPKLTISNDYLDQIRNTLGPTYIKKPKPYDSLRKGLTAEKMESIKASLRRLNPLSTALRSEGITADEQAYMEAHKNNQPFKYCFEQWEQAQAQGESAALARLHNSETTKREADALKWLLERAIEKDTYTQRSRTTKTINDNKSVSVTMRLPENKVKAFPAAVDAEVIALPEVKKAN